MTLEELRDSVFAAEYDAPLETGTALVPSSDDPRMPAEESSQPETRRPKFAPLAAVSSRLPWIAGMVALLSLSVAALLGVFTGSAPEPSLAEPPAPSNALPFRPIELRDFRPGFAVPEDRIHGDADDTFGETVDPPTWRLIRIRAPKTQGGHADGDLLRPLWWLKEHQAKVGGQLFLAVPECGIEGDAKVLAIEPCPPVVNLPGARIVTGVWRHESVAVIDLWIDGLDSPIGTTANHPFWSEDRQDFVRADELQPNEELHRLDGSTVRVASVALRHGRHAVYNLETHVDHVYHITTSGLLVHNARTCNPVAQLAVGDNTARQHLNRAMGSIKGDTLEAHHLISWEHRDHSIPGRAARGGFNINGKENGILLSYAKHQATAGHPLYNEAILRKLNRLADELRGASDAKVADELRKYARRLYEGISKSTKGLN